MLMVESTDTVARTAINERRKLKEAVVDKLLKCSKSKELKLYLFGHQMSVETLEECLDSCCASSTSTSTPTSTTARTPKFELESLNSHLEVLDMHSNLLSHIPSRWCCSLFNLQELWLGGNRIESLPEEFSMLGGTLKKLSLARNRLRKFPPPLLKCVRLESLYLDSNNLQGRFPHQITTFESLNMLALWGNENLRPKELGRQANQVGEYGSCKKFAFEILPKREKRLNEFEAILDPEASSQNKLRCYSQLLPQEIVRHLRKYIMKN